MKYDINDKEDNPRSVSLYKNIEEYDNLKLSEKWEMFRNVFMGDFFNIDKYLKNVDDLYPGFKEYGFLNVHYGVRIYFKITPTITDNGPNKCVHIFLSIYSYDGEDDYNLLNLFKSYDSFLWFNQIKIFLDFNLYKFMTKENIIYAISQYETKDQYYAYLNLYKIQNLSLQEVKLYELTNI